MLGRIILLFLHISFVMSQPSGNLQLQYNTFKLIAEHVPEITTVFNTETKSLDDRKKKTMFFHWAFKIIIGPSWETRYFHFRDNFVVTLQNNKDITLVLFWTSYLF